MTILQEAEDIFDRVEKKMDANPGLRERVPLLKEFVPPKPVEIPREVVAFVRGEISRNVPRKAETRIVEKGPDEKQINGLIEKAVGGVVAKLNAMSSESVKKDETITLMRKEYDKLKEEVAKVKYDQGVFIVHRPLPIQANKKSQFLTTDGNNAKWGPMYLNGTDPMIPIGDQTLEGSWRIVFLSSDGSLSVQKLESGTWNEKGGYQ